MQESFNNGMFITYITIHNLHNLHNLYNLHNPQTNHQPTGLWNAAVFSLRTYLACPRSEELHSPGHEASMPLGSLAEVWCDGCLILTNGG